MNKQNIMIDLETMGQGSRAAVVAIGAVMFDAYGLGETFYAKIGLEDAAKYGEIDPSTVTWWLKQSDEARAELTDGGFALAENAAMLIHDFITSAGENVKVWGCGSDFDNVILKHLLDETGVHTPWKFWNSRCYRTIKSLYPDIKMQRSGTHHNAQDDAVSQAEHLVEIAKEKGFAL